MYKEEQDEETTTISESHFLHVWRSHIELKSLKIPAVSGHAYCFH